MARFLGSYLAPPAERRGLTAVLPWRHGLRYQCLGNEGFRDYFSDRGARLEAGRFNGPLCRPSHPSQNGLYVSRLGAIPSNGVAKEKASDQHGVCHNSIADQEATVIDISKEADACASWPTRERLRALKRIIPRARVEEVLARTGHDRAHCPRLPGWFLIWFVIGPGLFCRDCYRQVFRWLQPFRRGATPGRPTLCEARKRLGIAPMRHLAERVIQLQGKPTTPGAFYRGLRTMALDGFVVDVPDTKANERAFGRPGSSRAPAAFPQARVLALCETGSHVLWRWLIKPYSCGEVTMAHYLLRFLREDMLLLWDRNFLSYQTLCEVRQRRAHLLARIKKNLIFEPIRVLDDGSYLSKMYRNSYDRSKDRNGILVRIIEYTLDDPGRPGSGEPHRLLTTLLDEKLDPAEALIVGYHERWEEELTIDALKTHQRDPPVLGGKPPGGVVRGLSALLLVHSVTGVLI